MGSGSVDDDTDELLAGVEEAEDVEPSFECVKDVLEVQSDPLLGYGAFGTVHYAVLIAESKSVALKAVSKAATRAAAATGDSQASLREILFGEAMLLEELAVGRHRNMLKFHGCATVARAHASPCSRAVPAMAARPPLPVRCFALPQVVARHEPCVYRTAAVRGRRAAAMDWPAPPVHGAGGGKGDVRPAAGAHLLPL